MSKKAKFYVVWSGLNPGIYRSWDDCQAQIKGVKGAVYKSFDSKEEAERAYASPAYSYMKKKGASPTPSFTLDTLPSCVERYALAVDAACSGNPGPMEYRGVYLGDGKEIFHFGPVHGTNNIGEFLAIVHGLALLKQKGIDLPIYSDSYNALLWIKGKKCKTKLPRDSKSEELFQYVDRAEKWLKENNYSTTLIKWETDKWGEIPADFGRK